MPAVTQGVISTLKDMGIIPPLGQSVPSTSSDSPQPGSTENPDVNCVEIVEGITPVEVPSAAAAAISRMSPHPPSAIAPPLDLGIDPKIKGKIWSNMYVELYTLLPLQKKEKIELIENGDGLLTCQKTNSGSIQTIDHWIEAFHIFVAIYTQKFPTKTANLMKYESIIRTLSKRAGNEAALQYDKKFRMWKEGHPDLLPWGVVNHDLHNEALALGLSRAVKSNNITHPVPKSVKYCFRFNNSNGFCTRSNCPFLHRC